ncbi:MAG: hypothetical protein HZC16_03380, partial [Candidatus Omnitrophica bacterium]|nr:hypothetical protein [Candidatus Omnitrophota bacterium]
MKKTIFICQFTENHLKVIKFSFHQSQDKFLGREVEEIPPDIDQRLLGQKLKRIFDKLTYRQNPIILSLPRSQATCRYLKIPSILPEEIEKIAQLQAMHYLPYPSGELITGYQIIETNKAGFSYINLIIVHQDIVERYL